MFKRIIDIGMSLFILLFFSPVLLVTIVWLYCVNHGSGVFFVQERPGRDEKIFKLIKFKSMTDERDAEGRLLSDEKRLTMTGKFMRSTSIDELPQLINVLKGDMALIGPRPLLPEYLPYYTEREKLRHTIRPGITGLAQVSGRNNLGWDERLELDVKYVERLSLKLDLKIMWQTIMNVVKRKDVVVIPGSINVTLKEERDASKATF